MKSDVSMWFIMGTAVEKNSLLTSQDDSGSSDILLAF